MTRQMLFIHGTGVRDIEPALTAIRAGFGRLSESPIDEISGVEWGRVEGPQDLDLAPALPPGYAIRAAVAPTADEVDDTAVLWSLRVTDPQIELRLLAEQASTAPAVIQPGEASPQDVFQQRLGALQVDPKLLADAGIDLATYEAARDALATGEAVAAAAQAAGSEDNPALVDATARALVATLLAAHPGATPAARDALVDAIVAALAPGRSAIGGLLSKALLPLATRVAVAQRAHFMDGLGDFMRDVTYYLAHGQGIRDEIQRAIVSRSGDGPVVLLAHSLGGVAAVDLMAAADHALKAKVRLLVTVGSQAPVLYLLDSLSSLTPRPRTGRLNHPPFEPWLNVYNRDDLLSFCAARVFVNSTITDAPVMPGVPFPTSHSYYWHHDPFYALIKKLLT